MILLTIPVLAFAVSLYYEVKIDKEIQSSVTSQFPNAQASKISEFTMENLIFHSSVYGHVDFEPDVYVFLFMKYAAIACSVASLLILVSVYGLSRLGSLGRDLLVKVFPPAVGFATISIAVLTVLNGLLLVGTIYYGESALIGRVHMFVVGFVGLGAVLGSIAIIGSLKMAIRPSPLEVPDEELPEDHSIWILVREIAELTGAKLPDVVVLGKSPTFFVYEGPFTTANFRWNGRLMYLSQDLSSRLEKEELKAIIAHEFGHFIGGDLAYTRKFHFGYRALSGAMTQLAAVNDWAMVIGRLPSLYMFQFILTSFGEVERRFSREREISADRLAIETCGGEPFVTGLTKVVLLVPLFEKARKLVIERVSEDSDAAEIEREFNLALDELVTQEASESRESVAAVEQPHPFDTHPTLAERIAHAGFEATTTINSVKLLTA
jgi:Zn-dependent protease with chaperone function